MEGSLAASSSINSPVVYAAIPIPRTEDDHNDDATEIPIASTGSSSPNYEGGCSSTNSQASVVIRNTREDEHCLVSFPSQLPGHSYIVQMPRDQIFRIPPPENAVIAKRIRQPLAKNRSPRNYKACFPWLYAFAVLFMVLLLALVILQLFLKPRNPEFIVKNLVFRNSTRPDYDISLVAKNLNSNIFTIIYEGAEDASLLYKRKTLAEGAFPAFEQKPNDATNVRISFSSLKRNSLPADLEKNLMEKKKMVPLEFSLVMEMQIRSKLSVIPALRSRKMAVECDFTVDSLAERTKILAQKCRTAVL